MKKIITLSLALFSVILSLAETKNFSFEFFEKDFNIITEKNDSSLIVSNEPSIYMDYNNPSIPFIIRRIKLAVGETYSNLAVSFSKRLIKKDIRLQTPYFPQPTNAMGAKPNRAKANYKSVMYPDSILYLGGTQKIGNTNLLSLRISPYVYDALNNNLYFIDSVKVSLDIEPGKMSKTQHKNTPIEQDLINALLEKNGFGRPIVDDTIYFELPKEHIEYMIITNENLKGAFKPLADWKRKKGVRSKIVTVEDIYSKYSGTTPQLKIKQFIQDSYEKNYTNYVLLGGDVDVVPAQMCYIEIPSVSISDTTTYKEYIPSDVFYSCLVEELDWDRNGNGLSGEMIGDNPYAMPTIAVTRAPVRDIVDVQTFVNKTIGYEQNPNYVHGIFQTGLELVDGVSRSDKDMGDLFYNAVVPYKWYSALYQYFDSYTYSGIPFSRKGLCDELKKGYQMVQVISHGNEISFNDGNENPMHIFDVDDAFALNSSGMTWFTTMACSTNAFDKDESSPTSKPCLSEALVRNPNSGVIGYLGASRFGWFQYPNLEFGSFAYETEFYDRLVRRDNSLKPYVKNFGWLINFTKASLLALSDITNISPFSSTFRTACMNRWVHYALNGIGDPETPLYNSVVMEFNNANATINSLNELEIDTGVDDAKVCVSGAFNDVYYVNYGRHFTIPITPGDIYEVWITKQNYKPKRFKIRYALVDPPVIKEGIDDFKIEAVLPNPVNDATEIKYTGDMENANGNLIITNLTGLKCASIPVERSVEKQIVDLSNLKAGYYTVTLEVNGIRKNSKTIIKK